MCTRGKVVRTRGHVDKVKHRGKSAVKSWLRLGHKEANAMRSLTVGREGAKGNGLSVEVDKTLVVSSLVRGLSLTRTDNVGHRGGLLAVVICLWRTKDRDVDISIQACSKERACFKKSLTIGRDPRGPGRDQAKVWMRRSRWWATSWMGPSSTL